MKMKVVMRVASGKRAGIYQMNWVDRCMRSEECNVAVVHVNGKTPKGGLVDDITGEVGAVYM